MMVTMFPDMSTSVVWLGQGIRGLGTVSRSICNHGWWGGGGAGCSISISSKWAFPPSGSLATCYKASVLAHKAGPSTCFLLSIAPGLEEGLTLGGLCAKPRSPPVTAPAVTNVSSSSSRPAALQPLKQGLVFTWGFIS